MERRITTTGRPTLVASRMERGLTIGEVGRATGVPTWWVVAYERGRWVPQPMRARIAAFLLKHPWLQDER